MFVAERKYSGLYWYVIRSVEQGSWLQTAIRKSYSIELCCKSVEIIRIRKILSDPPRFYSFSNDLMPSK